ncbi:terminase small subunit [Candidatus Rickettsiella viridis]|uniref:Terminase small subunit n=1 Tax=Candidatus Rickettsiella viridis TaxID=676208 RepID=A0A2Z5V6V9_9COXI|nr:terminase small subunit [Candidatus Rickettsiella viridis]BBB14727.1 terminase small subunit [Candidatus Rickettsiella viridis]
MKWNLMPVTNETRLPNGLTQRQFAFYNLLIKQMDEMGKMDAKQAAIEAGFSSTNASRIATRLLKKPEGKAYLKSLQVKSIHSATATMDWVMEKLIRVVYAGISDNGTINGKFLKDSLRALSEINKIKGYYAPEKEFYLNMTMDDVQEARARELTIKYTREY